MARRPTKQSLMEAQGWPVYAKGEPVGSVDRVYLETPNQDPEWLRLQAGGKHVLTPVEGAEIVEGADHRISLPYSPSQVLTAPEYDSDVLTEDMKRLAREHYGFQKASQESERSPGAGAEETLSTAAQNAREQAQQAGQQAKERASSLGEEARGRAEQAGQQAKDRASSFAQEARSQAAQVGESAMEQASALGEQARSQAGQRARETASSVREATKSMANKAGNQAKATASSLADEATVQAEKAGGRIRQAVSSNGTVDKVRSYINRHPLQVFFGSMVSGFVIGQMVAPGKGEEQEQPRSGKEERRSKKEEQRRSEKGQQKGQQEEEQKDGLTGKVKGRFRKQAEATASDVAKEGRQQVAKPPGRSNMRKRAIGLGLAGAGLVARRMLR